MRKQFIPLAIMLVIFMCLISGYVGDKEIIFPEIAALAIGAWLMEESSWGNKSLNFWLSPTMAAITGYIILKFLPYNPFLMVAGAFVLVVVQLKMLNSEMFPSLSAAILPIIIHTQSWIYPMSVCILTAIIACGKKIIDNYYNKRVNGGRLVKNINVSGKVIFTKEEAIHWAKLLISILLVSAIALYFKWDYIITPSLIVAFVGLSKPGGKTHTKSVLILIVLVSSAFLGVFWVYIINYCLYWPIWISAGLSMICVLFIYHLFEFTLPPAAAIALLPTIIPVKGLWMYPWQILIGSVIFLLIKLSWFEKLKVV